MMNPDQEPILLELAPLPREKVGPFLLLGLDKDASPEEIEAHWAQRILWARKHQLGVALTDINWAREVMNDPDKRGRADAASLNADTTDQLLRWLEKSYGADQGRPSWQPLDSEKPLADYAPAIEVPDPDEVRRVIPVPELPEDLPGVSWLVKQFLQEPIDPWGISLPEESSP
jgi:hypothetical protein